MVPQSMQDTTPLQLPLLPPIPPRTPAATIDNHCAKSFCDDKCWDRSQVRQADAPCERKGGPSRFEKQSSVEASIRGPHKAIEHRIIERWAT